jgi:uncharacterized protein YacL (UPF0231 family)
MMGKSKGEIMKMSDLDILKMEEQQATLPNLFERESVAYDDESCALCGSRNFELLEDQTFECYDCGRTFERGSK